jgi:hypothetical protein
MVVRPIIRRAPSRVVDAKESVNSPVTSFIRVVLLYLLEGIEERTGIEDHKRVNMLPNASILVEDMTHQPREVALRRATSKYRRQIITQ